MISHDFPQASHIASTKHLDGLRGLASVIVFIHHYIGGFTGGQHEFGFGQGGIHYNFVGLPFVRIIWQGGNASVVIFFLLSGYVLSISHLRKLKSAQPTNSQETWRRLLSAAVRRPVRLYLPCLVISFVTALLLHIPGPLLIPTPWMKPQDGGVFAEVVHFFTHSLSFFNPIRTHSNMWFDWYSYNMVMWSIPIELKGSFLVFGALALLSFGLAGGEQKRAAIAATALLVTAGGSLMMCWKWSMACFMLGMSIAIVDVWELDDKVLSALTQRTRSIVTHMVLLIGWYLVCQPSVTGDISVASETPGWIWLTSITPPGYTKDNYFRFWQSWGTLLFVYGLQRISWLQYVFSRRPLLFLGEVSFMLYLVHLPMIQIVGGRLHSLLGGPAFDEHIKGTPFEGSLAIPDVGPVGLSTRLVICMGVMLGICLPIAWYATEWVDQPSVRLSKKLAIKCRLEADRTSNKVEPVLPMTTMTLLEP